MGELERLQALLIQLLNGEAEGRLSRADALDQAVQAFEPLLQPNQQELWGEAPGSSSSTHRALLRQLLPMAKQRLTELQREVAGGEPASPCDIAVVHLEQQVEVRFKGLAMHGGWVCITCSTVPQHAFLMCASLRCPGSATAGR